MSNPMLTQDRWSKLAALDRPTSVSTTMTFDGALSKTLGLMGILVLTLSGMWAMFWKGELALSQAALMPWLLGGGIAGFVLVLINSFAPRSAPITAPLYAICEGLFLGAITMIFEARFPGLPMLAAVITIGISLGIVLLYRSGILRVSDTVVKVVVGTTIGVFIILMGLWVLSMFGIGGNIYGSLRGSGPIGIGFSVFMVVLAAFNIAVNLRFIEDNSKRGLPKWMEWQGAFGMLVTIVWLYIEVLMLLAKLRGRD